MPANDGTPDVWYGLIDTDGKELTVSTRRLAYDYRGAAASLRRSGHADGYVEALISGLWPSTDVLPGPEECATGKEIEERTARFPMGKLEQVSASSRKQVVHAHVAGA
jgi:hypothetical protein